MGWTRRDFAETFQRMLRDRYAEIGKEVRRLRENLGYSQETLGQEAGLSYKTISRIESPPPGGPHEIRGSTYRKLAEALGVTVEHLRAPLMRNAEISEGPAQALEEGLADAGRDLPQAARRSGTSNRARGRHKGASGGGPR